MSGRWCGGAAQPAVSVCFCGLRTGRSHLVYDLLEHVYGQVQQPQRASGLALAFRETASGALERETRTAPAGSLGMLAGQRSITAMVG